MSHVTDASDDLIQPFMIELSGLRGRLIRMGPVVEDVISRHDLPEAIQGLMAEFVVLAVALSAALKFDGIFTLQAKGNGPIRLMAADVTSDGGVRAYASINKMSVYRRNRRIAYRVVWCRLSGGTWTKATIRSFIKVSLNCRDKP